VTAWLATVSVDVRADVAVFGATAYVTVPLPAPLAPELIVIQATPDDADHAHPAGAVTAAVPTPPPNSAENDVGETAYVHAGGGGAAAAWVTVTVSPAMESVPVLALLEVLAAAANCTLPLPAPDAFPVTVSHDALLTAVQAHPAGAVTAIVALPPAAAIDADRGAIAYEHDGAGGGGAGGAGTGGTGAGEVGGGGGVAA